MIFGKTADSASVANELLDGMSMGLNVDLLYYHFQPSIRLVYCYHSFSEVEVEVSSREEGHKRNEIKMASHLAHIL